MIYVIGGCALVALLAVGYALVVRAKAQGDRAKADAEVAAAKEAAREAARELTEEKRLHRATRDALAAEKRAGAVSEAEVARLRDELRKRETPHQQADRVFGGGRA